MTSRGTTEDSAPVVEVASAGSPTRSAEVGPGTSTPDDRDSKRASAQDSAAPARWRSLDAIRGLAIVIMLLNGNPFPRTHMWDQLQHPEWHGLTLADLFFPLFLFAVGAAMTLSRKTGEPRLVFRRAAILMVLGIALTSLKHEHLGWAGVLQHIAIAYVVAWLVLQAPRKLQAVLAGAILAVAWAAFVLWAAPGADPWGRSGTFAHSVNSAITGNFSTEGMVQSVVSAFNVLAGAFVARRMKHLDRSEVLGWLGRHMVWLFVLSAVLVLFIPISKRLWTPSFAVLTTATSCMWLALFVWIADIRRWRWSDPLIELGANPIAVYVVFMTATAIFGRWRGEWPQFPVFGSLTLGTFVYGLVWVVLGLLFAHWLYRRRIFVKI